MHAHFDATGRLIATMWESAAGWQTPCPQLAHWLNLSFLSSQLLRLCNLNRQESVTSKLYEACDIFQAGLCRCRRRALLYFENSLKPARKDGNLKSAERPSIFSISGSKWRKEMISRASLITFFFAPLDILCNKIWKLPTMFIFICLVLPLKSISTWKADFILSLVEKSC